MTLLITMVALKLPVNLRVHHAKIFKAWLVDHEDDIEVFYLPSYSPELNPDEYLNCGLKGGVHSGKPVRTKEQLKKKVISHIENAAKEIWPCGKIF